MPKVTRQAGGANHARTTPTQTRISKSGEGASAWDLTGGLKILLYGQSGTGKTTLWGTFPGRTLALVCSGGSRPGELRSIDTPENRKRIRPVVVESVGQVPALLDGAAEYDNVVLDHVSGLQDLTLKEILGVEELPAQKGWGLASQQQWGQSTAQCKEILRALLSLPGNVVIVGQERTFGGKDDGVDPELVRPVVGVSVTPSLAGWLNPSCDYVLQTFKRPVMVTRTLQVGGKTQRVSERGRGVEYCARTEPHDVYMTKFRVPKGRPLPDVIVDPSYDKIVALINGE